MSARRRWWWWWREGGIGGGRTHPASVQDGGRLQHAAVDLRHLVPHHHAKLPHVRVRVEVGASHLRGRKEK